jgi:hypothetical protein
MTHPFFFIVEIALNWPIALVAVGLRIGTCSYLGQPILERVSSGELTLSFFFAPPGIIEATACHQRQLSRRIESSWAKFLNWQIEKIESCWLHNCRRIVQILELSVLWLRFSHFGVHSSAKLRSPASAQSLNLAI